MIRISIIKKCRCGHDKNEHYKYRTERKSCRECSCRRFTKQKDLNTLKVI